MSPEGRAPFAFRDVTQRHSVTQPVHADSEGTDTVPRVEPAVEQGQLRCPTLNLEEAESGAEEREAPVHYSIT